MALLVATVWGVDADFLGRLLQSCGRCRRGTPMSEYRHPWDCHRMRDGVGFPVAFDVVTENHAVYHRLLRATRFLVVPCRPDLVWPALCEKYADPASAFCNRMQRLAELAGLPGSMVLPFEEIGSGLLALQNYLGVGRPLLSCGWERPGAAVNCPLVRRYERDLNRMLPLPSWYLKWTAAGNYLVT